MGTIAKTSAQPHLTGYIGYFPNPRKAIKNESVLHSKQRKGNFIALLVFTAVGVSFVLAGNRPARSPVDQDYIAALASANRFLQAWQNQDHETAVLLLTDKVKQHTSEKNLEAFFTPAAHTQQAYEISSGKKLGSGRYLFTVKLFNSAAGGSQRHLSHLIVTHTGKNDWAIDKLP